MNREYTPDFIESLGPNEIFVFGSNLAGKHHGGAARTAWLKFGAIEGKGVGMQGQSYAIPTMHGGLKEIKPYVDEFIRFALANPGYKFYVTRVGCGIAGFDDSEIGPLFAAARDLENVVLPRSFAEAIDSNQKKDDDAPEMTVIRDKEFEGERPLYKSQNLILENVTIHVGESSLKECRNIVADHCTFEGKYPFWETNRFVVRNCVFRPGARSALWYSSNLEMTDTLVEAPKMFRDSSRLFLKNVKLPDAQETFWHCDHVRMEDVEVAKGDYLFMFSSDIEIERYKHQGNYAFQYARNIVIRDAVIDSKDALWNTENVTVINSTIDGEYLAWYSKNLHLINCHIGGTQPLCYAEGLVLENCTFAEDADLAFEYSSVEADIRGHVVSVKNPTTGRIIADTIGDVILDENILPPADCSIEQRH